MTSALKWIKLQETTIPQFTIGCITNYFISRLAADGLPTNDFKDLNSHAYPLFKAGHIQSIFVAKEADNYMIKCICLPEMKKDILYKINFMMDSNGEIISATCGCPAGVGPTASCKHISALCYALEEFCRIKELRSPRSCTSELQKWNQPRKRKLDACAVDEITFVKHEYGKKKKQPQPLVCDPRPPAFRTTSESSVHRLKEDLQKTGKDIVLVHLLPGASLNEAEPTPSLPPPPPLLRQQLQEKLQGQPQPVNFTDIASVGLELIQALKYTEEQKDNVEIATRLQSDCKRWFEERQLRITASKFGVVIKRKRQHTSLVSQMLYSSIHPSVLALQWGRQHEHDALHEYQQTLTSNLILKGVGFFVDGCGYLGASPDGIVVDDAGRSVKLVEVKCPYKARDKTIEQACSEDKSFCCNIVKGKPCLKLDHDYYYQVQGQMAITGIHTCDFVVWTPKAIHVQTITFDNRFWISICLPKLEHFFYYFFLPEIMYPQKPNSPYDYSCHSPCMYQ